MTKTMRFYKRLLDLSLFVSYIILILFLALLSFSVFVGALDFNDPNNHIFVDEYIYLRPIFFILIAGLVISVIGARVFLGYVTKHEELETVEDYKKSLRNQRKDQIMNQLKLDIKDNTIEYNEDKYLTRKERKQKQYEENQEFSDDLNDQEEVHTTAFEAITADRGVLISDINQVQEVEEYEEATEDIYPVEPELQEKPIVELVEEPDNADTLLEVENGVSPVKEKKKRYYTRLTKSELEDIISEEVNISSYRAKKFVNGLLSIIQEELVNGNEVRIEDFGKFYKHFVKRHQAVDPRNGEELTIEAHYVAKFTAFSGLKDKITNDVIATSDRYLKKDSMQNERVLEEVISVDEEPIELVEKPVQKTSITKQKSVKDKVITRTKKDIINYINNTTQLSMNKANKFLFGLQEVIQDSLGNNEDVDIEGFGRFTTIHLPSKEAVNPSTNEKMIVPEHDQIRLRFDDDFKSKIK